MAIVIKFDPSAARGSVRSGPQGPAQIVIFPGVRYEYHGDAAQAARRQRDRLDIAD
jgi:hypothetical protein